MLHTVNLKRRQRLAVTEFLDYVITNHDLSVDSEEATDRLESQFGHHKYLEDPTNMHRYTEKLLDGLDP